MNKPTTEELILKELRAIRNLLEGFAGYARTQESQAQEWLTLREAADALGISEVSARRWVKAGKLAAAQPGRKYLIPKSAVEDAQAHSDGSPLTEEDYDLELKRYLVR